MPTRRAAACQFESPPAPLCRRRRAGAAAWGASAAGPAQPPRTTTTCRRGRRQRRRLVDEGGVADDPTIRPLASIPLNRNAPRHGVTAEYRKSIDPTKLRISRFKPSGRGRAGRAVVYMIYTPPPPDMDSDRDSRTPHRHCSVHRRTSQADVPGPEVNRGPGEPAIFIQANCFLSLRRVLCWQSLACYSEPAAKPQARIRRAQACRGHKSKSV